MDGWDHIGSTDIKARSLISEVEPFVFRGHIDVVGPLRRRAEPGRSVDWGGGGGGIFK